MEEQDLSTLPEIISFTLCHEYTSEEEFLSWMDSSTPVLFHLISLFILILTTQAVNVFIRKITKFTIIALPLSVE